MDATCRKTLQQHKFGSNRKTMAIQLPDEMAGVIYAPCHPEASLILAWESQNTSFYIKMVTLLKIKTGYICKRYSYFVTIKKLC